MKKINDITMNPVRMRIIQLVIIHKRITTLDILKELPDVPRTTLYRHVKELVDAQVLLVVEEHKVRGQIERTLAPNMEWWEQQNCIDKADDNFYQLLMGLYGKCHTYFAQDRPDPVADRIFFSHMVLMLSDGEMDQLMSEIKELFYRYQFPMEEGRKVRDFTLISSPNIN